MAEVISGDILQEIEAFDREAKRFLNREIPEEKFKRFRLQHGVYGQRQPGVQMVRVKIPAGLLNAEKLRALADVAEKFSTGKGHVTTRQDLQFHFINLQDVPATMIRLAESGLTTREACGNTVRNVTACHLAGVCPTELFNVAPVAQQVAYHLLRNPINQDLPRKFKISFSGCPTECGLATIHDIGFVAAARPKNGEMEYGFKTFVGGGLGSSPKLGKLYAEFLPLSDLLPTCEAILTIFDTHGNRKVRSKARMKFVVEQWGIERFKERVAEVVAKLKRLKSYPSLTCPLPPRVAARGQGTGLAVISSAFSPVHRAGGGDPPNDTAYAAWLRTNVLLPSADGTVVVQVKLTLGDITASQLRSLADIVDQFSPRNVRTTHQQNIILTGIQRKHLSSLYFALQRIGLADPGAEQAVDVIACPGADSCQLALTSSMGLGEALVQTFARALPEFEDLHGLRMRISGCPNSCGHHHIAGIGLHGVAKKVNGILVPHYQLHLGGEVSAERSVIGRSNLKIPAANVPAAVLEMIRLFRENREEGEPFNRFVERFGRETMTARLAPFTTLRPFEEIPEAYRDYRSDTAFDLEDLGPGECAGTMIDLMENLLRTSRQSLDQAHLLIKNGETGEGISLLKEAILRSGRALLIPFGVEAPNDGDLLKEFQHRLVEQGFVSELFESFTEDLGQWALWDERDAEAHLERTICFLKECQAAYDLMDINLKLRKREEGPFTKGTETDKAVAVFLDLSGVACPMNFVQAKLQLEEMEPGQQLEMVLDEGEPIQNVPRSIASEGHKIKSSTKVADGRYHLIVEKVG